MKWIHALPIAVLIAAVLPRFACGQTFSDLWSSAGFSGDEATQGVALGDFNNDGKIDVFINSILVDNPIPFLPDLGGPNRLYANMGGVTPPLFSDVAPMVGLALQGQPQGAAWADYDNDGLLDLYVVQGLQEIIPQKHKLYHQVSGMFDDSPSAYVSAVNAGRSVCWADYDNDGYVDVFVTNGFDSPSMLPDSRVFLFRNNHDGSFTDVTITTGLEDHRNGYGCGWSDYDNDGDMDLYVANHGFFDPVLGINDPHANALYKNELKETGTAHFSDVAAAAGVTGIDVVDPAGAAYGAAWGDFNNDGWMDLYVVNGFSSVIPIPTPNRLFKNNGDGTFADVTLLQFKLNPGTASSTCCTWGDFDNDMDLDLYVGNASIPILAPATNDFFVNDSSPLPLYLFDNNAASAGLNVSEFTQACASADLNGDGYVDIYSVNGIPAVELFIEVPDNLFVNNGGTNHWLQLDLIGVISNRSAVGARVLLETKGLFGSRTQTREVNAGMGYNSMDDLRVEFGLGSNTKADVITIRWPSGCVQTLNDVAADQVLPVVETCASIMIQRAEYAGTCAGLFPLPPYEPAPPASPYRDSQPVLMDARTLFYQHPTAALIHMVKAGTTIEMSW